MSSSAVTLELLNDGEKKALSRVNECINAINAISSASMMWGLSFCLGGLLALITVLVIGSPMVDSLVKDFFPIDTQQERGRSVSLIMLGAVCLLVFLFFFGKFLAIWCYKKLRQQRMNELATLAKDPEVLSAFKKLKKIYQAVFYTHEGWVSLVLSLQGGPSLVEKKIKRIFAQALD